MAGIVLEAMQCGPCLQNSDCEGNRNQTWLNPGAGMGMNGREWN